MDVDETDTLDHRHGQEQNAPQRVTRQQNQPEQEGDQSDEWLFSCLCESARAVSTLLSCLQHVNVASSASTAMAPSDRVSSSRRRKSEGTGYSQRRTRAANAIQPVTVYCSRSSLTFHVYGTARQSQASVDLQASLFSDYRVVKQSKNDDGNDANNEEDDDWKHGGEFCVNLSTVLECLHVFGTQGMERTKLCLSYNLTTEIFKMELLEDGVLATAAIPGMLPPEDNGNSLALAFRSSPIVSRVIIKSEWLKEALQELELVSGATACTIALGPDGMEFAAVGHVGECLVSLPSTNGSIVSLESRSVNARTYPLTSFLSGMRGLEFAEETCMSINDGGMIAIQHQVLDTVGQGSPSFVDFIMCCLEEDEDESTRPTSSQSDVSLGWNNETTDSANKPSSSTQLSSKSKHYSSIESHLYPSPQDNHDVDNDDDDDDDDSEQRLPPISAAPLFGTVVQDSSNGRSKRRRRHTRSAATEPSYVEEDEDDEPLDINETATPTRRYSREDEDGCSSPELVYG